MREVLPHLSSMWLSQGSALYSQERPFGDRMPQVTKQKANLKVAILIPPIKFLTMHFYTSPHVDIEAKWMQKSQLCQNQGECQCWLWQASVFAPVFCYCPLIFSHRDLCCFAQLRGAFHGEATWVHILQPPLWGLVGAAIVRSAQVTNDISMCLIRGISFVRLTWGFVAEDIYCCECTQAAVTHRCVQ